MTTKETLRIHQPEDILAYIPHLLGYCPEDSLVALTMQGKLLGATLRVDLPGSGSPAALSTFAEQIRSYLLADEAADGVVLAVYTDVGWEDGRVVTGSLPLLLELQRQLDDAGLSVRDAWLVGPEFWRSAFCADQACCPVPGLPIEQIKSSRLNAEMVYRGSTVGMSPRNQAEPPSLGVHDGVDPAVLEAEIRFTERLRGTWRNERCLDAILDVWRQLLDSHRTTQPEGPEALGVTISTDLAGFLRATLGMPVWRDAVVVMAAAGERSAKAGAAAFGLFRSDDSAGAPFDAEELGLRTPDPASSPDCSNSSAERKNGGTWSEDVFAYGDVLLGRLPEVPDWGRLDALQRVVSYLFGTDEAGDAAAAALTLQGWVAWCKGSGSRAHACLTAAEAAKPGYRLAELLEEILRQGTICPWALRPASAWGTYKGGLN
ncbi:DUF4192 domain-containing protein [Paenarthrobacter sp. NPDC089322]|uniref:DUF4192 domain-containing protein n=1 Tax=Paenarthrobacter sp. NPDC089322 TaxID=3155065 RepID=UPI00341F1DA0